MVQWEHPWEEVTLFGKKHWVENDIILVKQLLNCHINLLIYSEFVSKLSFPVTPKEYAVLFDALHSGVLQLLQGTKRNAQVN